MTKAILTILTLSIMVNLIQAQLVDGFEEFELSENSFLNGSDADGAFTADGITLPNNYDPEFDSWLGWAISNVTDNETPGFTNQYSAIPGIGHESSANYAVSFQFGQNVIRINEGPQVVEGMYITNSTYAFLSMRDGDAFAKKFGGATGEDEDFFMLTIEGYSGGAPVDTLMNFMLADYRFDDPAEDYILDEWTWLDLSFLGEVDSVGFSLSSSDNGEFGMNTPAYFCIDNVTLEDITSSITTTPQRNTIQIFPNPTSSYFQIEGLVERNSILSVVNASGQQVMKMQVQNAQSIDISQLQTGMYFVSIKDTQTNTVQKLFKQ